MFRTFIVFFSLTLLIILFPQFLTATTIEINPKGNYGITAQIAREAYKYIGTPYVYGGISKDGVDCSGLVYCVFNTTIKKKMPRRVSVLIKSGTPVKGKPLTGDLLFFNTTGIGPSHVGISIGNDKFIHAASQGKKVGVIISSLESSYYKTRYLGARRVVIDDIPMVEIKIDSSKENKDIPFSITSGMPFISILQTSFSKARVFNFEVSKDKSLVFSKRIRLNPKDEPVPIWFIPDNGEWTVSLVDIKIGALAVLNFSTLSKEKNEGEMK